MNYLEIDEEIEPLKSRISWIFRAASSNDANGREQIGAVIDGVNALIAEARFDMLDKVFSSISPATASPYVLLALVRSSAPVRLKLNNGTALFLR